MKKLIIIGGGIAGVSAAHAARAEYPGTDIALLSSDPYPFYNRIALNSYLTGGKRRDHLGFYPLGALKERGIKALRGRTVSHIKSESREVELSDGSCLEYDSLIVATGAESVLPAISGIESEGVYPLWTLEDAMKIRGAVGEAESVFILGAGVLGVEIAVALHEKGKKVTLTGSGDRVLPRQLNREAAACYLSELEAMGIEVKLSQKINRISRQGRFLQVGAADAESWDTDLLLIMAGAKPDISLALDAGLECRRGILVDEFMGTAVPNILACGNCTELQDGTSLLWNPARAQGEIAGRNAFDRRHNIQTQVETVHVKTPNIPTFTCGRGDAGESGERKISDSGKAYHRSLVTDKHGSLISATFVGDVHGAYAVEQAIHSAVKLPEHLLLAGDIDEIIIHLESPRMQELYPGRAWVCRMCGYIYEGDDPPEICPVCSVGKDQFQAA